MKFQRFSVGLAAATLTLSFSAAWAQERGRPSSEPASRPSNGDNVGSAVPRSGGESPASPSGATSSPSSPANNGSPSASPSSPSSWMDPGSPSYSAPRAPVHPDRADRMEAREQRSRPSGGESSGRAVPRSESGGNGGGRASGSNSGSTSSTNASSGSESQPSQGHSRAIPANSRPRDGRNQTGTAAERTSPPYNGGGGYYPYYPGYGYGYGYVYDPFYSYYYSPYYRGYGYWNPWGYGYGLGYFSYDPYLFGGIGDPGYYGGGGSSSGGGSYVQHYQGAGSLRLKIKPANAQVYIDGYFVGVVDSFDGAFQKLNVDAGPHRVELKAEGYQTTDFEVVVTPGDTITYKGDMKRQ